MTRSLTHAVVALRGGLICDYRDYIRGFITIRARIDAELDHGHLGPLAMATAEGSVGA